MDRSTIPFHAKTRLDFAAGPIIVDVRHDAEFSRDLRMVAPAFHRPPHQIENWGKELPSERSGVTYCAHGDELSQRSAVTQFLRRRVCRAPALVIAALVVCAPPTASAQEAVSAVDIGQSTGGPPAHFDFLPAGEGQRPPWTLIEDKTAVAGLAIERRGAAAAVARSLAIYQAASLKEAGKSASA